MDPFECTTYRASLVREGRRESGEESSDRLDRITPTSALMQYNWKLSITVIPLPNSYRIICYNEELITVGPMEHGSLDGAILREGYGNSRG